MYHVFRYDDYSSRSCASVEERLFESLARRGMQCTVGVIPAVAVPRWQPGEPIPVEPLGAERWQRLRYWADQGMVDPALHGYSHLAVSPVRGIAEFGDRVLPEQQRALLQAGKRVFEDNLERALRVFIPPWNGYCKATLDILVELGITVVSAGFLCTLTRDDLLFLPATLNGEGTLAALERAVPYHQEGPIVVTNLHDYDFAEAGMGGFWSWERWEEFLDRLQSFPGVNHASVESLAREQAGALGSRRLTANAALQQRSMRWPARLLLRNVASIYWPEQRADRWAKGRLLSLAW